MKILVVEDDPRLQELLASGLGERGAQVVIEGSLTEGRRRAVFESWDVIILDRMLPGGDGVELCRHLRTKGDRTPILLLTARASVGERVDGLDAGADDYLVKPFSFKELWARVQALGRRPPTMLKESFECGGLEVDLSARQVVRSGECLRLTAKEWDLLECFIRNHGKVIDRATITAYVWDDNHDPFTNALEVLVRRLRAKIDDDFEPRLIHTHRGAGYRFGE